MSLPNPAPGGCPPCLPAPKMTAPPRAMQMRTTHIIAVLYAAGAACLLAAAAAANCCCTLLYMPYAHPPAGRGLMENITLVPAVLGIQAVGLGALTYMFAAFVCALNVGEPYPNPYATIRVGEDVSGYCADAYGNRCGLDGWAVGGCRLAGDTPFAGVGASRFQRSPW